MGIFKNSKLPPNSPYFYAGGGGRTPSYVKKYLRLANKTTHVEIYRLAITVDGANVGDL